MASSASLHQVRAAWTAQMTALPGNLANDAWTAQMTALPGNLANDAWTAQMTALPGNLAVSGGTRAQACRSWWRAAPTSHRVEAGRAGLQLGSPRALEVLVERG
ncbi:hypothetical protein CYMTET_36241 [Cymbomonas tetramitiformis]|uniref:Uncharacterized protein n=1 Tax=Cymbomonas tetramitiformis TaxID=36881 RepID=A0AAE0CGF0_9CHLO|nr:hypothetical protein CYMTET_36241 [Cymbomonas tetramitiformis]